MAGGGASSESESTSYGYLPYIAPGIANAIGQQQALAAQQAANYAKQGTSDALASITKNYTSAVGQLAPTTAAGYQAQLELNKYLGLDAVKPQAAPTAPTAYVPTDYDLKNYVLDNLSTVTAGKDNNAYLNYGGVGATYDGWSVNDVNNRTPTGMYLAGKLGIIDPEKGYAEGYTPGGVVGKLGTNFQNTADVVLQNQDIKNAVTKYLTDQYNSQNKDLIAAQQAQYQQDLDLYNQNKAWYDKYAAEGPYTSEQITKNITEQPGYQAQQQAGIDSIQKAASARGLLSSGNMLKDLSNFSSQLQGEYYNNTLNRLAQQAAAGTSAASQLANTATQNGSTLAGLQAQLGDTLGNAALSRGQSLANSLMLGNQQYKQVVTGQSRSSQSSGGGLGGIGSILGGLGGLAQGGGLSGLFSSKTLKTKGKKVDFNLDDLDKLKVEKWKYKKSTKIDPEGTEHIGPYAEDFRDVFGVGDGRTIPIVSSLGILYGLVKELNHKVDQKKGKS